MKNSTEITKFNRISPRGFCVRHESAFVFCDLLNQSAIKRAVEHCVSKKPDISPELLREFLLLKLSELLEEMVK